MIYLMIINRGISIDLNQVRDSKISDEMNNNKKKLIKMKNKSWSSSVKEVKFFNHLRNEH